MKLTFESIRNVAGYQPRIPSELWHYDPAQQIINSCKCDAALLPFSLLIADSTQYDGEPAPAFSSALISMHERGCRFRLFVVNRFYLQLKLPPELLPEQQHMRKDIEDLLSDFLPCSALGKMI